MEPEKVNLKQLCVFCGEKPASKNKEHILPQWLLKLTGDPSREAYFGMDMRHYAKTKEVKQRKFAFSSFQFPACVECNGEFSKLEGHTQLIMEKVLDNDNLDSEEITTLLDWFDKVRTGLWLAMTTLDDIVENVAPKFYITKRISLKDRLLFIYDLKEDKKGLMVIGATAPIFHYMPSCFSMFVNNKYFFSVSTDFLVSEGLGFSYGKINGMDQEFFNQSIKFKPGKNRASYPIVDFPYASGAMEMYQAIYSEEVFQSPSAEWTEASDNIYLTQHLLSTSTSGRKTSKIFYKEGSRLDVLPEDEYLDIQPPISISSSKLYGIAKQMTNAVQISLWKKMMPKFHMLTDKQKEVIPEYTRRLLTAQKEHFKIASKN